MGFGGQNRGRGGAIVTPNELVLTFWGSYVCANFGENRSINATVTNRHTDRQTDANRFYNLSHAICYSYGTDNKGTKLWNDFPDDIKQVTPPSFLNRPI